MNSKKMLIKLFIAVTGLLLHEKKSVVFDSFSGLQYSDNPKAISEKLFEIDPSIEIIWNLKDSSLSVPSYIHVVSTPIRFYYEVARCKCFVKNTEFGSQFYKRKGQLFIQTGHGDRPLKRILFETNRKVDVKDNQLVDFCIAGSTAGIEQYRKGYGYKGKIIKIGSPRNDILINNDSHSASTTKASLGLKESDKVLLYAPTFRDDKTLTCDTVNVERILDILNENYCSWVCLVRSHILSKDFEGKELGEKIYDVSDYPDMAELLLITDFLISDYSSCSGDYILKNKPVILAVFDYDLYKENCRDLVCDLNSTGYILARSQDELETIVRCFDEHDYLNSCQKVMEYFEIKETGSASLIVANMISNHVSED